MYETSVLICVFLCDELHENTAVLPAEAHAKIVFRLVAGQDPDLVYKSLEEHVAAVAPTLAEGLRVEVQRLNPGAKAYKVNSYSLIPDLTQSSLYLFDPHSLFSLRVAPPNTETYMFDVRNQSISSRCMDMNACTL